MLGIAALVRALVLDALQTLEKYPDQVAGDRIAHWLAPDNRWLSSRYGLGTRLVCDSRMQRVSITEDIANLLNRLAPTMENSTDRTFLLAVQNLDQAATGTERQRHIYRETGSWREVLEAMMHGWVDELDSTATDLT
jgi:gamma-glutamyl:cysteine ligase YbdK (ATP-grasp superfamily)